MSTPASTPPELQAAERALATALGVTMTERMLEVTGPVGRVRIIESGAGDPLVLVHGGGGIASQWLPLMAALPGRRASPSSVPGAV